MTGNEVLALICVSAAGKPWLHEILRRMLFSAARASEHVITGGPTTGTGVKSLSSLVGFQITKLFWRFVFASLFFWKTENRPLPIGGARQLQVVVLQYPKKLCSDRKIEGWDCR